MNNINYIINLLLKDNNISAKVKNLQANFSTLDNSVNKVNKTVNSVSAEISGSIENVNASIKEVNNVVETTTNNIDNRLQTISFAAFSDNIRNISEAFKSLSNSGVGFEKSMADLSSITGIAGKELADLGQVARQTGKDSGLGAAGAADAFALLASQIQVDKIGMEGLKTLQKETITLAQASGMGMADAATAMAATINQFGLEATEANRVINVLAAGSKYGAAEISDLAQSFKVTGAVAAAAGLSVEQSAGAIEVLSKSNLKGAEAGTALRNIIVKMQTSLKMNLGETGLSTALEALKPKLNDVTWLTQTFGAENLAAAQFLIANAAAVDEMTTAVTGTNVAQEQAAVRTNTTAEQMKRMQATIDDLKIGLFNISGGMTAYIAALGDSAVIVAQMVPLLNALKSGLMLVATANGRAAIATTAKTIAEKTAAAVTWTMTAAQTALNAVMSANPVALIVIAIAALVSGVIAAYKNVDGFRRIVDAAWEGIKRLASSIWDGLIKAFEKVSAVLTPIWGKLKALLGIQEETVQSTVKATAATEELGKAGESTASAVDLLSGLLGNLGKKLNTNLATIGGIEQKISDLKTKQKEAMGDQAIALEKEIRLWEKKKESMQNAITIGVATPPELKPLEAGKIPQLNIPNPKVADKGGLIIPVKVAEEDLQKAADRAKAGLQSIIGREDMFASMQQGLGSMVSLMQNLSGVVGESAGAWLSWGASLLQSIAQAIPQIIALTNTQVASAITQVTANTAVAGSGAAASVASIPIVGWIMAGAAVASVIATLAALPKPKPMANGGIAYGTTFAMVGEYPGAANNPEVIAPLSKLRQLIESDSGGMGGTVEFVIKGNRLAGVLSKEGNRGKYF